MTPTWITRTTGLAVAALIGAVTIAAAGQWSDKTILKFSEPVMVPGATLQPGSYVFDLLDSTSSRHVVEIRNQDDSTVVALAQAVPMKRAEARGDVVVKFNPTDAAVPPALKGWYAPGSVYGHQFIYPEEQARKIASRTKTIVLSTDVPGSDLEKGTLRTYSPSGAVAEWRSDEATAREWETWQRSRPEGERASAASSSQAGKASTAPMVAGNLKQGMRIELDALEDSPQKYIGQTVSVDAEVEEVFGPRLFTIDEPHWGDLAGEILVFMPANLAALVRDDDRVTVTGTVKPFVRAEVEREWGWLGLDPDVEVDFAKKPILVASRIVGGNNNFAMVIDLNAADESTPVGTSGAAASKGAPLTALDAIASGENDLVGREVTLKGVEVASTAQGGGFYVRSGDSRVLVLPAQKDKVSAAQGDTVSIEGVILQMPRGMREKVASGQNTDDEIYIYATSVSK